MFIGGIWYFRTNIIPITKNQQGFNFPADLFVFFCFLEITGELPFDFYFRIGINNNHINGVIHMCPHLIIRVFQNLDAISNGVSLLQALTSFPQLRLNFLIEFFKLLRSILLLFTANCFLFNKALPCKRPEI